MQNIGFLMTRLINVSCGYSLEVPRQGASYEYKKLLIYGEISKFVIYCKISMHDLKEIFLQDQRIISGLKEDINKLEKILSELRLSADKALQEKDSLKKELDKAKIHVGAAVKLSDAESKCTKNP